MDISLNLIWKNKGAVMFVTDKLRLRKSVGIVVIDNIVEFFLANIRESVKLEINFPNIVEFLGNFDGLSSIEQISSKYNNIDLSQLLKLVEVLYDNFILIKQDDFYSNIEFNNHHRLINVLEDYFHSVSGVLKAIEKLNTSKVMIIGLGAVGSHIAKDLVKSGVGEFIFVDDDIVDISNLHRQNYIENNVGKSKALSLKESLEEISTSLNIEIINAKLSTGFFNENIFTDNISLIINCADEPNVDFTSEIISKYAMKKNIPHIVGGGYNLHLTLIGQSIIPYQTACFQCFKHFLKKINSSELENVRKLHRESRKLGSFSPLSGIAANLASLDAFKILIGKFEYLNQSNKRIEFNMRTLSFKTMEVKKYDNCEWCGQNGR
jgi:molybdopterin/thiamine biosynthesis adenylyltransferase